MHTFTLVIVPGSRTTAYNRAGHLIARTANRGVDYYDAGGRWSGRLQELGLVPADDPWPEAIPVSRIPQPVPDRLIPITFITPRGAWLWRPVEETKKTEAAWVARVNRLVDKYRGGHTAVMVDVHC